MAMMIPFAHLTTHHYSIFVTLFLHWMIKPIGAVEFHLIKFIPFYPSPFAQLSPSFPMCPSSASSNIRWVIYPTASYSLSQGLDIRTYTQDQLTAFIWGFYTRNISNERQKHSINGIHISLCHPQPPTIPPLTPFGRY